MRFSTRSRNVLGQHHVGEGERVSDMFLYLVEYSSSISLFCILLEVILHALDIFRSTCIMIVPVQFADVEVWICAFCMSFLHVQHKAGCLLLNGFGIRLLAGGPHECSPSHRQQSPL